MALEEMLYSCRCSGDKISIFAWVSKDIWSIKIMSFKCTTMSSDMQDYGICSSTNWDVHTEKGSGCRWLGVGPANMSIPRETLFQSSVLSSWHQRHQARPRHRETSSYVMQLTVTKGPGAQQMAQSPSTPSNKTVLSYRNRNIMGATYVT